MTDTLRDLLRQDADHVQIPTLDPSDVIATGERRLRRRRHRLVAGLAACAVVGIVAAGLVGRSWWDTGGAGPADQPTSPTQESATTSSTDDRVGFVGLPPPGTPPTGPATGQLVASAVLYNSGTWVYADGRIINVARTSDEFKGYVVRQLTPSGVEAMRSFLLDGTSGLTTLDDRDWDLVVRDGDRLMSARGFTGCTTRGMGSCPGFTDPDWLPASAWEDPTFRPFVAHAYQFCLSHKSLAVLPATTADIYLASPRHEGIGGEDCRAVATSDASILIDALEEAGTLSNADQEAGYGIEPILPHGGQVYCTRCG